MAARSGESSAGALSAQERSGLKSCSVAGLQVVHTQSTAKLAQNLWILFRACICSSSLVISDSQNLSENHNHVHRYISRCQGFVMKFIPKCSAIYARILLQQGQYKVYYPMAPLIGFCTRLQICIQVQQIWIFSLQKFLSMVPLTETKSTKIFLHQIFGVLKCSHGFVLLASQN